MKWLVYSLIALTGVIIIYSSFVTISFGLLFRRPLAKKIIFLKPFFGPNFKNHIQKIQATQNYYKNLEGEKVEIRSNNTTLRGVLFSKEGATKLVVFIHGYYSQGFNDIGFIGDLYKDMNVDLMIIDQRACGNSGGVYTSLGAMERYDVREWLFYLNNRFEGKKDIYLHGVSMGAATSLLASGLPGLPLSFKGIIADCGYSRTNGVLVYSGKRLIKIKPRLLYFGINLFARFAAGFNLNEIKVSSELKKNTTRPILFIHGTSDRFVPSNMSVKNFKAAQCPKKLVLIEGAEHCESYFVDKDTYTKEVREFLNE